MSDKEIRIRLPVEELDLLLEPIKSKNQVAEERNDDSSSDDGNYQVEDMDQSTDKTIKKLCKRLIVFFHSSVNCILIL